MVITLREARIKRGISQKELSIRADVPQNTISTIETRSRENPGIGTLWKLAKGLGCPLEELYDLEEGEDVTNKERDDNGVEVLHERGTDALF